MAWALKVRCARNGQAKHTNLSKSMRATINCEKMNVWHQTRPWQMARCTMKGIVTSQECNFLNGFECKMHTPSCMYSKRCWLLCLYAIRVLSHSPLLIKLNQALLLKPSWTSRTYHSFFYRHEVKVYMTSLPIIQNVCYINFEFRHHFCHFDRGADLDTLRLFNIW
jgi:hypothetical protein